MPPQGGDHPTRQAPIGTGQFQSTPPHGRRPKVEFAEAVSEAVSIHASAREATRRAQGQIIQPQSFNPRLRTGGDDAARLGTAVHAGFNPRLRTGGDRGRARAGGIAEQFQSTPPHGRRRSITKRVEGMRRVSIHASAREATSAVMGVRFSPGMFQSTPPHGRRHL